MILLSGSTSLQHLMFPIHNIHKPSMAIIYCLHNMHPLCGCLLPFVALANPLWLLPSTTQPHLPCRLQLPSLPHFHHHLPATIILWQQDLSYSKSSIKNKYLIIFVEETQNYYENTTQLYIIIMWTTFPNALLSFHAIQHQQDMWESINILDCKNQNTTWLHILPFF